MDRHLRPFYLFVLSSVFSFQTQAMQGSNYTPSTPFIGYAGQVIYHELGSNSSSIEELSCEEAPNEPEGKSLSFSSISTISCSSTSEEDSREDPNAMYSYSYEYNIIIEELIKKENQDPKVTLKLWKKLHNLGESFVAKATQYGMIIIDEQHLPYSQKAIAPCSSLGGIAGGAKYICNSILFKFAQDHEISPGNWLYGGKEANHDLATKTAAQELLSANYVGSFHPMIKVPLMAVIDYCGHRLMAMALLPLDKTQSLVYGSADGGQTVFSSVDEVNDMMRALGRTLNLKKHMVNGRSMALCGDIEVHKCWENQYYCIDTARVFPPELPAPGSANYETSIHFNKLRPQFVKRHPTPLSSDAYTGFQSDALTRGDLNTAVEKATESLHKERLPKYIHELLDSEVITEILSPTSPYYTLYWLPQRNRSLPNSLIVHMHKNGLNVRHLGYIVTLLEKIDSPTDASDRLKNYMYNTMMTRVIKNHAKQELKKLTNYPEYRKTLRKIMNYLTCKEPKKSPFWTQTVPTLLNTKFSVEVTGLHNIVHHGFQLVTFCNLMGVNLLENTRTKISKLYGPNLRFNFTNFDIQGIQPNVKYLNFVDLASGIYLLKCAEKSKEKSRNDENYIEYVRAANDRLQASLLTWCNPSHPILPENITEKIQDIAKDIKNDKEVKQRRSRRKSPATFKDSRSPIKNLLLQSINSDEDEPQLPSVSLEDNRYAITSTSASLTQWDSEKRKDKEMSRRSVNPFNISHSPQLATPSTSQEQWNPKGRIDKLELNPVLSRKVGLDTKPDPKSTSLNQWDRRSERIQKSEELKTTDSEQSANTTQQGSLPKSESKKNAQGATTLSSSQSLITGQPKKSTSTDEIK